jgi:hypothetical protein
MNSSIKICSKCFKVKYKRNKKKSKISMVHKIRPIASIKSNNLPPDPLKEHHKNIHNTKVSQSNLRLGKQSILYSNIRNLAQKKACKYLFLNP